MNNYSRIATYEFADNLKTLLKQPLPKKKAHEEMMFESRKKQTVSDDDLLKAEKSGVLLLFYPKNDENYLVFIERTVYDGVHSGQIAFPGGKSDLDDNTLVETALRETYEEIGVESSEITILGNLSDIYITPSNNLVSPYVGICNNTPDFRLNKKEVNRLIEVPFLFFINKQNKKSAVVKAANGSTYEVPCFDFKKNIIWGATAMILNELIFLYESE